MTVLDFDKALAISQNAMKIFTESYIIKFDHAQSLVNTGKYEDCIKLLKNTEILPHEGAGYGRTIWQQANLLEALRLINDGKINLALGKVASSRLWPEILGVGRPYNVNESLEDLIEAACIIKSGQKEKADKLLSGVPLVSNRNRSSGTEPLAGVIALKAMKKYKEADELLSSWSEKENDKVTKAWALNLLSSQYSIKKENLPAGNAELDAAIIELPKHNLSISIIEKISKQLVGK